MVLECIFTQELGTKEEYENNYSDTPFGILIRKIAKMDRDSAYAAFSSFIAEERPNAGQIHFINQVVDYVVENGYINSHAYTSAAWEGGCCLLWQKTEFLSM